MTARPAAAAVLSSIMLVSHLAWAGDTQAESAEAAAAAPAVGSGASLALSLGTTAALVGLGVGTASLADSDSGLRYGGVLFALGGLIFAPSLGQVLNRDWRAVGLFTGGRVVCTGVAFVGLVSALGAALDDNPDTDSDTGVPLLAAGLLGMGALAVWDMADAAYDARAAAHAHAPEVASLGLAPLVAPAPPGGSPSWGLALTGQLP